MADEPLGLGAVGVSDDLDSLRARSAALDSDDWKAQRAVYEAILRLEKGDLLAARGLALALVKLEELDHAEEVVEDALLLHAGDHILSRRQADIASARRWAHRAAAQGGTKRSSVTRAAST